MENAKSFVDKSTFLCYTLRRCYINIFSEVYPMISRFEQFSTAISCIYRCIQKIERVEMAKFGLKGPHVQCLLAIKNYPEGITSAQLCTVCEKDKAAISRTIGELEQEALVVRDCAGGNRYRARLYLTEKGDRIACHVDDRVRLAVEKAGEGMDEASRRTFYSVLGLIAGNLQTICTEGLQET